ncbi:MAG: hypothetical protein COT74_00665 [Bdellovibrionales bacterium CG10_big_fil_rev_8_21_14_0_10_45_34]|nr:MAG: hypothetical protein COT74_00665 [Bdellovibrionales bacterium CG10_big_fil_rev_8_21_14_0_10_45_34]
MIDNWFRAGLPAYTTKLIRFYSFLGLTPNMISVGSLSIALVSAWLISRGEFTSALIGWWLSRLLDGTDGIYARATQQATPLGAFLDIVCDMASYSAMIFGFSIAFPNLHGEWILVMGLYVLCITGALALGSLEKELGLTENDNRGLKLGAGLAEGGETGIAYSIFLLAPQYIGTSVKVWIAILIFTVIARVALAFKELKQ